MIDTATIERYMRDANPIPHLDDVDPDEFARFVAAAHTRRAATMHAPTQHQTTPSPQTTPLPQRRRRAWALAAAFILTLAAVGVVALALRNNTRPFADEPAPPTTVSAPPTSIPVTTEEPISVRSLTWSRVPLERAVFSAPTGYQLEVSDIVAGGPGFVAVGGAGPGGATKYATVWTSPDGYTWSRVPHDEAVFGVDLEIKAVTVGGPGLVAVGGVDVWTSPDGYEWSRIPRDPTVFHPITDDLRGVIAGGPGLVAFGESGGGTGAVWTSPDGYTWTQLPDRMSIDSMVVGGPGLVAVGGRDVWTSPDGYTWTRVPHDPSAFGKGTMVDVAAGMSGLVAVGFQRDERYLMYAAVWTSPDGFSWTRVPHDEATFAGFHWDMTSVAAVGDGFVAVGSWAEPNVWTSTDGVTWTRVPDDDTVFGEESIHKVITGGPGIVALDSIGPQMWVATPTNFDEPTTVTTR
jgi:hypothetical protein